LAILCVHCIKICTNTAHKPLPLGLETQSLGYRIFGLLRSTPHAHCSITHKTSSPPRFLDLLAIIWTHNHPYLRLFHTLMHFWEPSTFFLYSYRPAVGLVVVHFVSFVLHFVFISCKRHALCTHTQVYRILYFPVTPSSFHCLLFPFFLLPSFIPRAQLLQHSHSSPVQLCNPDLFDICLFLLTDRYRSPDRTTRTLIFWMRGVVWYFLYHFQCWIPILLSSSCFFFIQSRL